VRNQSHDEDGSTTSFNVSLLSRDVENGRSSLDVTNQTGWPMTGWPGRCHGRPMEDAKKGGGVRDLSRLSSPKLPLGA
jgi:hypothetical protein